MLEEACRQRRDWQTLGVGEGPVAVNVSPSQIEDGEFDATVLEVIEDAGLRPSLLELEVTEQVFLTEFEQVRDALLPLRRRGVGLSLDDFGTGYSSLRSLQGLQLDKLKIPIEFIWGLGRDPDCEAILDAIIGLGHRLGHTIVADGVENKEQFSLLCLRGCDVAQGNYLLLASADDLRVVGEAGNGEEAVELVDQTPVDVVILDVSMPGMGGLETLRRLKERSPPPGLLVLSMHPEDQYAERFLRAGADGYMTKERAAEELAGAIRTISTGERYVSGALRRRMEERRAL